MSQNAKQSSLQFRRCATPPFFVSQCRYMLSCALFSMPLHADTCQYVFLLASIAWVSLLSFLKVLLPKWMCLLFWCNLFVGGNRNVLLLSKTF